MGNLICCYHPSDQKKGTSVKTLLRRTEKPSKERKRIDDLVADALKREKRDERQKRKREKKCLKKQSEDSPQKDAIDADDGDVSIKQQTLINNHDVKQNTIEDANVIPNTKHTHSSEAASSDDSEVNNTNMYLPKTHDTDINNTAEHETNERDLRELSDHQNIPNIPLIDTTIDDTQPSCDVIDYLQARVNDIDNNSMTQEKPLCPETTEETTVDDITKNDAENLDNGAHKKTTNEKEIITTDTFVVIESNTDQECRKDENTKTEDIHKSDSKETTAETTVDDITKNDTENLDNGAHKKTTNEKEIITTDTFVGIESNTDQDCQKDESTKTEDIHKSDNNETYNEDSEINNSTIHSQNVTDVNVKDVEMGEEKVTIDKEHLDPPSMDRENNDDIHNATIDSQDVTEVNDKDVAMSETKERIDEEQSDSPGTTTEVNEYLHDVTIAIPDVTEVNDTDVDICEAKVYIYNESTACLRTTTEGSGDLECLTTDRTTGNKDNSYNDEHISTTPDTAKDINEIVHSDKSLPSEEEKTETHNHTEDQHEYFIQNDIDHADHVNDSNIADKTDRSVESEECEDSKYTRNTITTTHDKGKGETKLDFNPEDDKATTYENEVISCESNLIDDREDADDSTRTKENGSESMGHYNSITDECSSNELSVKCCSLKESNEDPLEKVDINTKQNHELCSITDDKHSLKLIENNEFMFSVTSDVKLQSETAMTSGDTNTYQDSNIGDTSIDGHDCTDTLEQMPHDVESVSDNKRVELIPRSRSIPIRQCVALVSGFAKELKQANVIPKQRNKFVVSTTEPYLNKTKPIIVKRSMPKSAVLNRVKSWHRRRTPVKKRVYPGALDTMIRIGQKPQLKEIERLKKDSMNFEKSRKILTEQDRHGSIKELKWSRHMRTGVRLEVRREKAVMDNEKYKMIASIANGRYNRYNHLPPVVKPSPTSMRSHSSSTSHIKPATIQTLRERYGLGKNQSSSRCVSPNRSNNDFRYSSLSRISSTCEINHITELSRESTKKVELRSIMRQFEKTCKDVERMKSNGTDRAATPSRNNTSYVGIGRQTSFTNLGMDSYRRDF